MKRTVSLILIFCLFAIMLSGCSFTNVGIDGLLSAPKLSKEQSEIHDALIESVGKNIQLKYPLSGDERSAFVIRNLDDEKSDEAIVFYKKTNTTASESTIRINILDQINGKWQSVYDSHQVGEEVDNVIISKIGSDNITYITVGFGITNQADKTMQVYKYSEGVLESVYTDTYSIMDVLDLDNDKKNEIVLIKKPSGNETPVFRMCKFIMIDESIIVGKSDIDMRNDSVSFVNMKNCMLDDNTQAVFIDSVKGDGNVQTEVIYYDNDVLVNPFIDDTLASKTTRLPGYFSQDIDNDGVIEIPLTSPFTGYIGTSSAKNTLNNTEWKTFDKENSLTKKYDSYYNINNSYVFVVLGRWAGKVTIKTDTVTDEIVFYKYDGEMKEGMPELLRIMVTTHQKSAEYITKGYTIIKSQGQLDYLVKLGDSEDKDFLMTMSEIKDCFHIL